MSLTATPPVQTTQRQLVGNRLMLLGALLYLGEFIGIAISGAAHLPEQPAVGTSTLLSDYAGHADGLGFLIGWFGIVLLGRVLVVLALRASLTKSAHSSVWMDLSVVAMSIGVVMEVASEALATAAGQLADAGQDTAAVGIDRGGAYLAAAILAPTGLAIVLSAACMLSSKLFPRALCGLGLIAGAATIVAGLLSGPSYFSTQDTLTTAALAAWAWMVWAGILMWRHTPHKN